MSLLDYVFAAVLATSVTLYVCVGAFVARYGRKSNFEKRQIKSPITFSVYLPTFNEEKNISSKLENLLHQTAFEEFEWEILVYDCSTDGTRKILEEYATRYPKIRIVKQSSRTGMAKTFNEAIANSNGHIFIKTDCDSLTLSHETLKDLIQSFHAESLIGAVTGVCVNERREGSLRGLMTRLQIAESNADSTVVAHSCSFIAIKKDALTPVNPDSMAEDTEEFIRVRKRGFKTIVNPNVISVEKLPTSSLDRFRQKQRRAEGIIKALFENADMLFNSNFGLYGLLVLPLNLFLLVVSPFLLLLDAVAITYFASRLGLVTVFVWGLCLLAILSACLSNRPRWLGAFIDAQVFALIGFVNFVRGTGTPTWKVHRE